MNILIIGAALVGLSVYACAAGQTTESGLSAGIAADEAVVLFRTAAWLDEDTRTWQLPIHAWVYEPQDSQVRKAVIEGILSETYNLQPSDAAGEEVFASRVNWLIVDSERGKVLIAKIGDRHFEMPATGPRGHSRATVPLLEQQVQRLAQNGEIQFSVTTREAVPRSFSGTITLIPPGGVSVISDIDDTIKISHVTDRAQLLEYTLFREFEAAPGMASVFTEWAARGASVHYVSSSPWQLYPALESFAESEGFPAASFHLKLVRFRDETLLDLFKKGTETKPAQIESILQDWPDRQFVLVGDSGEQDPEVYSRLMRQHPDQIRRIYIRNVTGSNTEDARFRELFDGIEAHRWRLFTDPEALQLP